MAVTMEQMANAAPQAGSFRPGATPLGADANKA